ncbi:MAG: hypothetical protein U1C56_00925, partial [Candidatus Curtissbacteria bacterium]|nr:hypothetical protein [Candidatus Curtissbacteria bacterium]
HEYAAKLAGMNRFQVDNAIRIMNRIKDKPELIKVAEHKGLNAVRPIAVISTKETAKFWAEKADQMTKNELELYVRAIRNDNPKASQPATQSTSQPTLQPASQPTTPPTPQTKIIAMQLTADIANKLNKYSNGNFNELMEDMLELYEKELEEKLNKEKPETKEHVSRNIPQKIKKFILKRSFGKCEFPNCNKKYQELHHTERFGSVKRHNPEKIIALCKAHHGITHLGLVGNENFKVKQWRIEKQPDHMDLNRFIDDQVQLHHFPLNLNFT